MDLFDISFCCLDVIIIFDLFLPVTFFPRHGLQTILRVGFKSNNYDFCILHLSLSTLYFAAHHSGLTQLKYKVYCFSGSRNFLPRNTSMFPGH